MNEIETIVQGKIEADADFQAKLAEIPEEEREASIQQKKSELISQEFKSLREQAEEAKKAKELADNYKARAEKAEKLAKESGEKKDALSNKDILYLAKSGIHDDDLDEVLEMAQLRKVSVQEAHKFMKPILDTREEERRTAIATQTRGARGTSSRTPEQILSEAEQGAELEGSTEDMQAIFQARQARRSQNRPKR